jgi:hypothetical protein
LDKKKGGLNPSHFEDFAITNEEALSLKKIKEWSLKELLRDYHFDDEKYTPQ